MRILIRMGACAAALWGGAALAQSDAPTVATVERDTITFEDDSRKADTGVYALIGGGAEGYTGKLAPQVQTGFSYGVNVGYRPLTMLGVEVGYSGGITDVDTRGLTDGGISDGPDIVRNGGQAAVVADLTDTKLQPYVLGGVGIEHFNIRNDNRGGALGFEDDTSAYIPAGVGLRYQMGKTLTADARVNYNFLLDQDFAPTTGTNAGDGRYQGMLSLGGTY